MAVNRFEMFEDGLSLAGAGGLSSARPAQTADTFSAEGFNLGPDSGALTAGLAQAGLDFQARAAAAKLSALQSVGYNDPREIDPIAEGQVANPRKNPYFSIEIEHLPTKSKVKFDGWVTNFADNFTSQWNGTPAYGRMDDMYTFQRTSRKISLAFDVIAVDKDEATLNQYNMNRLAQFLYPVYSDEADPQFQVLKAAPLLRMKYSGLVRNSETGEGLVGFLQGFSYAPNVQAGPIITSGPAGGGASLFYKEHTVQLEFTVLHTHKVGWGTTIAGVGGAKYSFGSLGPAAAKHFPHAVPQAFDPAQTDSKYVNALPNPQLRSPSEIAGQLATDVETKMIEEIAAEEAAVLSRQTALNASAWERNHPILTARQRARRDNG